MSSYKTGEKKMINACQNNDKEKVLKLINDGEDVNEIDRFRRTPIFFALSKGNEEIVNILLENFADINHRDFLGHGPIDFIYKRYTHIFYKIIHIFSERGERSVRKWNENENGCTQLSKLVHSLYGKDEEVDVYIQKWLYKSIKCKEIAKKFIETTPNYNTTRKEGFFTEIFTELKEEEERKMRLSVLLCTRKYSKSSIFYEEILPLDVFKHILYISGLVLKNPHKFKKSGEKL